MQNFLVKRRTLSSSTNPGKSRSLYNRVLEPLNYAYKEGMTEEKCIEIDSDELEQTKGRKIRIIMCKNFDTKTREFIENNDKNIELIYDIDDLVYMDGLGTNVDLTVEAKDNIRFYLTRANLIVTSNEFIETKIREEYGNMKTTTIRTCIDSEQYKSAQAKGNRKLVHMTNGDKLKLGKSKELWTSMLEGFLDRESCKLEYIGDDKNPFGFVKNIMHKGTMDWPEHKYIF